jgi:nucleotide-binding universal stress UspA family protein
VAVLVALLIWAAIVVVSMIVVGYLAVRWGRDPFGWLLFAAVMGPIAIIALAGTRQSDREAGVRLEASGGRDGADVVLIAADGSEPSLQAARYVAEHHAGSAAVVLAVLPIERSQRESAAEQAEHERAIEQMTSKAMDVLRAAGVDVRVEVGYGKPGEVIVGAAEQHKVETIVVGRKGAGLTKALIGSVSDHVVRHADAHVVVVD